MKAQFNWCIAIIVVAIMGVQGGIMANNQDQTPPAATEGRNRLGETTSPYLLQHAANPVHWYPWGNEAFEAARREHKPIFMSIGYSTCYWCHVMERESFEDQEVADYLNEHFISIKVDREERPDVDEIYMTATQIINRGRGGWPMSVFLDPVELKPFFAGTYFPKEDKGTRRGFMSILAFIDDVWKNEPDKVQQQADAIANAVINRLTSTTETTSLSLEVVKKGVAQLLTRHDRVKGGFATAPKFPMSIYCDFLMEAGWETPQVKEAVKLTLDEMLMGGMYDQVGGGFHRYSTDANWLVPHFEKMLYDNGQLVSTYANAYERTGETTYARVIEETLAYVNRELSAPDGGFFSAQDAETNHLEGETYLWRDAEFVEVLNDAGLGDDVKFARAVYGINQGTNFRDPHHPEEPPSNVLHFIDHPSDLATSHDMTESEFNSKIDAIDTALLEVRDTRDQPLTDDKVITAWNGLMITGFADAARVLNNDQWVERAQQAADFILTQMRNKKGMLLRTWRDGKGGGEAFLVDYAAMIRGLLAIHSANQNPEALASAIELYDQARSLFFVEGRGWYDTQEGQSDLFVRTRALSDGALPAATSLILADLVSLAEITNDPRFKSDAMKSLNSESQLLDSAPTAAVVATQAFNKLYSLHPELFADSTDSIATKTSPVHMTCSPTSMQLVVGESAEITIQLAMTKNWHVNSNAPGNEYAIPLSFKVLNDNVTLETSWPTGKTMISAGESVDVYSHNVSIPIVLHAGEGAKGSIQLMVTWQACDAESCLQQETMQVPCAITVK